MTTTVESKTNFLRPVPVGQKAIAVTTPVHLGRSLQVWKTEISREDGKLEVAKLALGLAFRCVRLRVGMVTAGRQRGILQSQLLQLQFQLQHLQIQRLNLGQQQPNNHLTLRRLLRNHFFRDL